MQTLYFRVLALVKFSCVVLWLNPWPTKLKKFLKTIMNISNILNHFNLTGVNNIVFYPLLIITVAYSVAFFVFLYEPKNKNIYVFITIPKIVSIICVSVNAVCQILTICSDDTLFKTFTLCTGAQILTGFAVDYKVKFIFVSHVISSILHFCFYCYCKNYDAGIISEAFHPSFEY